VHCASRREHGPLTGASGRGQGYIAGASRREHGPLTGASRRVRAGAGAIRASHSAGMSDHLLRGEWIPVDWNGSRRTFIGIDKARLLLSPHWQPLIGPVVHPRVYVHRANAGLATRPLLFRGTPSITPKFDPRSPGTARREDPSGNCRRGGKDPASCPRNASRFDRA
jgi:hypothetical protein